MEIVKQRSVCRRDARAGVKTGCGREDGRDSSHERRGRPREGQEVERQLMFMNARGNSKLSEKLSKSVEKTTSAICGRNNSGQAK